MQQIMKITKDIDRLEIQRKNIIERTFKQQQFEFDKIKRENQALKDQVNSLKYENEQLKRKLQNPNLQ